MRWVLRVVLLLGGLALCSISVFLQPPFTSLLPSLHPSMNKVHRHVDSSGVRLLTEAPAEPLFHQRFYFLSRENAKLTVHPIGHHDDLPHDIPVFIGVPRVNDLQRIRTLESIRQQRVRLWKSTLQYVPREMDLIGGFKSPERLSIVRHLASSAVFSTLYCP